MTPRTDRSDDRRSVRRHLAIIVASILLLLQLIPTGLRTPFREPINPVGSVVDVPPEVDRILRRSCYDCHSSSTVVPWYGYVQPVGGWLATHVRDGRQELNFDLFGGYRPRRQVRKLEQIAGEVRSGAMPLPSYLLIHFDARLSDAERSALYAWVDASLVRLRELYPPDSLQRPR